MPLDLKKRRVPAPVVIQQEEQPTEEFYGNAPGFDAADLYSVPLGMLGTGFKWTTGLVQRPILTGAAYLGQQMQSPFEEQQRQEQGIRTIAAGDILGSSFTPELEANPVDAWAPDFSRRERERLSMLENPGILDRLLSPYGAVNTITQVGTDPATYFGAGLLSRGKMAASAAAEYNAKAMQLAKLNKSELVVRPVLKSLAKKLGLNEELVAGAKATGLQPTLAGRISEGEQGLKFGIGPYTSELPAVNKYVVAPVVKAITQNPLTRMLEAAGATEQGQKIGRIVDFFRERPVNAMEGMTEESGKRVATSETYQLANELNIPAMEESLAKLSKAIEKTPAETTKIVGQWQGAHLKWDFNKNEMAYRSLPTGEKVRAILAETDPAKRLAMLDEAAKGTELSALEYQAFIESEEFVQKLTAEKKLAMFNELNTQVNLGRQAMQNADARLGLGGKQLGAEFHAELQRIDKAIEKVGEKRNVLTAQLADVMKRGEALKESLGGAGRAAGATAGGTATVSAGSSLSPADFAMRQLDHERLGLKAQLKAIDETLFDKTKGLTAQRAAVQQKLIDTPIWFPHAVGEDIATEQGFGGLAGKGGAKPTLKQGRTKWDEYFRNVRFGYKVEKGEVIFGEMPKTKPELLTQYAKNQERIAALEATVAEASRIRGAAGEVPFKKTQAVKDLLREYEHSPGAIRRMTDEQAREALIAGQARRTASEAGSLNMNANMQGAGATAAKGEARVQQLEEAVRKELEAQKATMAAPLAETERILAKAEEELNLAKSTSERLNKEIVENTKALEGGEWHSLEGVPMYRDYIEAAIKKHGSASTSWEVPLTGKTWSEVLATAKKEATADTAAAMETGAKMTAKAAEAEAKEAALFFSQDLTHAFAGKLKRFYNDVNQNVVERMIVSQTKAIRKADWDGAFRASQRKGATWEAIQKTFKKDTGMDIGEFLPEGWQKMKPSDAIGPGPRGYQSTTKGGRFAEFKTFDGYVPIDWMKEYSRYRIGAGLKLAQMAMDVAPALFAVTTAFKRGALAFPDYHTRNALTDLIRMHQEGLLSRYTASDMTILMKHVFPEITRNGWGDFSKFAGIQVPGMTKTLDVLLREATENGVLHTGPMWQVVFDAAEDVTDQLGRNKVKGMFFRGGAGEVARDIKAGKIPNRLTTFGVNPRALASREEFSRLSAFFEAQRQGMKPWAAGTAAQKALFDYSNLSPFGDFARRTGLAPFITFSMKNIPAQARLLIEKPWQFAAILHIQKAINDGVAPSPEGMSRWARDKFNVNLRVGKDENGRPQYEYVTLSGVIPQADLADIMQNPTQYASGQLGPLFKMAYEMMKEQEVPEEERQGVLGTGLGLADENVPILGGKPGIAAEAWGGKPLRFAQQVIAGMPTYAEKEYLKKHGKVKQESRVWKLLDYISPMQKREIDAADTEDKAARRITRQLSNATSKLQDQLKLYRANQTAVDSGMIAENPMEADIQKARADYNQLKDQLQKELLEVKRKKRRAMQGAAAP